MPTAEAEQLARLFEAAYLEYPLLQHILLQIPGENESIPEDMPMPIQHTREATILLEWLDKFRPGWSCYHWTQYHRLAQKAAAWERFAPLAVRAAKLVPGIRPTVTGWLLHLQATENPTPEVWGSKWPDQFNGLPCHRPLLSPEARIARYTILKNLFLASAHAVLNISRLEAGGEHDQTVKGTPGRPPYPQKVLKYALTLKQKGMTAKENLAACRKKFDKDEMPLNVAAFRTWLNAPRKVKGNRSK